MQAWGLFESKHGHLERALRLLRRAVVLDESLVSVLRWSRFQAAAKESRTRRSRTPTMQLQTTHATEPPTAPSPAGPGGLPALLVARPAVRYTVPQSARGWRGRAEMGEDPSRWYDAEGGRNGPPANYWRQAMDERLHRTVMVVLDELVECGGSVADEGSLPDMERRMGVKSPLTNRKLLRRWALVLSDGRAVATLAESPSQLRVPAILEIRRAGARKTVMHRYGEMDAHLEEGEALELKVTAARPNGATPSAVARLAAGSLACAPGSFTAAVAADADEVAAMLGELGGEEALPFRGKVTLMNDYLLVTRDSKSGRVLDCFMLLDEA